MKNKFIIPLVLLAAAAGFWYWNSQRIAALRFELDRIKSQPLPERTNHAGWKNIIGTLLGLGMDIYKEFRPGGSFHNGKETLGDLEIDEYIRSIA